MHETELWITKLFNDYLAGVGNALTGIVGMAPRAAPVGQLRRPCRLLVALIIMVLFAILRPRLSADRPGKLQHTFELIYDFLHEQAEEQVGHDGHHYLAFFGTIFIFILFCNLIGVIPGFRIAHHGALGAGGLRASRRSSTTTSWAFRPTASASTWRISRDRCRCWRR